MILCFKMWSIDGKCKGMRFGVTPGYSQGYSCLVFGLRPLVKWISIQVLVQVWISRGTSYLSRYFSKNLIRLLSFNLLNHFLQIELFSIYHFSKNNQRIFPQLVSYKWFLQLILSKPSMSPKWFSITHWLFF